MNITGSRIPQGSLARDINLLTILSSLAVIAGQISIEIPHVGAMIEGAAAFGYLGFILIRRHYLALILAVVVSFPRGGTIHPLDAVLGNMLYFIPEMLFFRLLGHTLVQKIKSPYLSGFAWSLITLAAYQVISIPVIWLFMSYYLDYASVSYGMLEHSIGFESVFVSIFVGMVYMLYRINHTLKTERRELSITLNSIGDGVIVTDSHGNVVRMNPVAEKLTGWTLSEALSRPVTEIFNIVNAQTGRPAANPVEQVLKDGVVVGLANHTTLISRDGARRQIADSAAPVRLPGGDFIGAVMVFRDVTDEYETRTTLHRSVQFQKALIESSPLAIISLDSDSNVLSWNHAAEHIFGWTAQEVTGEPPPFICPNSEDEFFTNINLVMQGNTIERMEIARPRKDGATVILRLSAAPIPDTDGSVHAIVALLEDITQSKKDRQERERLLSAIEQTDDIILITDPHGRIVFVNPAFETITGYSLQEVRGMTPGFLRGTDPTPARDRELWETIVHGGTWEGEFTNHSKKGNIFTVQAKISPVRDPNGTIVNFVGVLRDISAHLRLSKERDRLQQQIQKAQKMESIGRLAGGVSHDLNNMLAPILGYGEILQDEFADNDERKIAVDEIVQAGMRARDLVRQLLAFSRKQILDFRPISLNQVIRSFQKLLRRTIREDISIRLHTADELPLISGDIGQLEQVIMNLAINAQDAMPEGGAITIETAVAELDAAYAENHPAVVPGPHVMLSISDTGTGMTEDIRNHIFEPFFTTKEETRGTGLGLATVYGITKQHRANIWLYSEPGEGTTFKIYFPITTETGRSTVSSVPQPRTATGSETVLIVEDNQQVRKLAETVLKRLGYNVLVAPGAREALELVEKKDQDVHLLLTDIIMPKMDGKNLARLIQEKLPSIRILYMSGYTSDVIALRGIDKMHMNFIQKPFSIQGLAKRVREVLDKPENEKD